MSVQYLTRKLNEISSVYLINIILLQELGHLMQYWVFFLILLVYWKSLQKCCETGTTIKKNLWNMLASFQYRQRIFILTLISACNLTVSSVNLILLNWQYTSTRTTQYTICHQGVVCTEQLHYFQMSFNGDQFILCEVPWLWHQGVGVNT